MKALIHIGLPKCGSTSIQEFLKLNGEELVRRGIRYAPLEPRFGSQFELGLAALETAGAVLDRDVARLVTGVRNAGDQRAYVRRFDAFLDAGLRSWTEATYVGSSEHLTSWLGRTERVQALDRFLSARFEAVRYVVYLRPQADIVLSGYSEHVRRGGSATLAEHLAQDRDWLDHLALVRRWEGAVGPARLDVRLLTADFLHGADLIADFCAVMSVSPEGLQMPPRMRGALPAGDIRLRRWLNRFLRVRQASGGWNRGYLAALRVGALLRLRGGQPLTLSADARARLEARFAESNEALRAARFPDRVRLF
ncbi:MAG: hypothetical protein KDK12_06100 [Rhodobacteraceae bacterium]|nr:hypothetical protein [Paracoccaceae bacterium]